MSGVDCNSTGTNVGFLYYRLGEKILDQYRANSLSSVISYPDCECNSILVLGLPVGLNDEYQSNY